MNAGTSADSKLKAGIIAAGRGERLQRKSGPLKPLVPIAGRTMIEHVLSSIAQAGASETVIIINDESTAVRDCVSTVTWPFALRWIVETTPSSMHSFLRVVEDLAADGDGGPFLISTVDTISAPGTYDSVIDQARRNPNAAVVFGLTNPGQHDEKPLFVQCAPNSSRILAIGPQAASSDCATAGVYAVRATILREAEQARRDGLSALRLFFVRLLERGYHLEGVPVSEAIDVDHPVDIGTAEEFLRRMPI